MAKNIMYFRGSIGTADDATEERLAQMLLALEIEINQKYMGKFRMHVAIDDEYDAADTYTVTIAHDMVSLTHDVNTLPMQGYELAGSMVLDSSHGATWHYCQPMIKRGRKARE